MQENELHFFSNETICATKKEGGKQHDSRHRRRKNASQLLEAISVEVHQARQSVNTRTYQSLTARNKQSLLSPAKSNTKSCISQQHKGLSTSTHNPDSPLSAPAPSPATPTDGEPAVSWSHAPLTSSINRVRARAPMGLVNVVK